MNSALTRLFTGLVAGAVFFGAFFVDKNVFSIFLLVILLIILIFEWPLFCKKNKRFLILTPFYPVFPVLCLIYLNHYYHSKMILIPLYPFLVSWVSDTGGYLIGSFFGKHKLCPSISPKKSWEGLFGSFVAVFILNSFLCAIIGLFGGMEKISINNIQGMVVLAILSLMLMFAIAFLSLVMTLIALAGDLFESYLKRKAELKDSGSLLPGHGGLLDRFDSVFFVAIFMIFLAAWFSLVLPVSI